MFSNERKTTYRYGHRLTAKWDNSYIFERQETVNAGEINSTIALTDLHGACNNDGEYSGYIEIKVLN